MNKKPHIINFDELTYEKLEYGTAFQAQLGPIANRLAADKLGYRITKLAAGKRAFPKHAHFANEEMFFVLEGNGVFILGDDEHQIRKGDFIAAPANPKQAHQIFNNSDQELVYLCVSTMLEPEVAYYPDSDKIGVLAGNAPGRTTKPGITKFFPADSDVDYWQDESDS